LKKTKNAEKISKNSSWFIEANGVKFFQIRVRLVFIYTYISLKKKKKENFKLKPSGKPLKPSGYRSKPPGKPVPNRTEGAFEFKFKFDRLPTGYW
jgi:hypothetical protein